MNNERFEQADHQADLRRQVSLCRAARQHLVQLRSASPPARAASSAELSGGFQRAGQAGAPRDLLRAWTTSLRMIRLAITRRRSPALHQRHAALRVRDRQGRGEARGVGGTHQPTDQRHAQQEAMPALAKGIPQRVAEAIPPIAATKASAPQALTQSLTPISTRVNSGRVCPLSMNTGPSAPRSPAGSRRWPAKRPSGSPDRAAPAGSSAAIAGAARCSRQLQHRAEVPGMLAGSHSRPVQLGKGGWETRAGCRPGYGLEDLGAHREKHRLDALRGGLRRGGAQRRRATRPDQGRQLPGHQCQVARADSLRANVRRPPRPPARGYGWARRAAPIGARAATRRTWRALSASTPLLATAGVEGEVSKAAIILPGSRAGLRTVVTPSSTLRRPSSRMLGPLVGMPGHFLLGGFVVDQRAHVVVEHHQLIDTGTPAIAMLVALSQPRARCRSAARRDRRRAARALRPRRRGRLLHAGQSTCTRRWASTPSIVRTAGTARCPCPPGG